MRTQIRSTIAIVLTLAGVGCASSQAEQVKDARMAQVDENAQAVNTSIDQQADAQKSEIKSAAGERRDLIKAEDAPDKSASTQLVNVSEERATYVNKTEARLEKLGVKIDAAKQKITALGSHAPTALRDEYKTTAKEHSEIKHEVDQLNATPASSWQKLTDNIDERVSNLDDRVSKLNDAIGDVS